MDILSCQPNIVLNLTTHAHSPPLRPAPQLKYDLRTVPNPPKAIRDAYTGVSKRLRDHMLEHEDFVELLERAEAEIGAQMENLVEIWRGDNETSRRGERNEQLEKNDHDNGKENNRDHNIGAERRAYEHEPEYDREIIEAVTDDQMVVILTVGIFCARGQHRSVAFAEELSRKGWPKKWAIRLEHRDLGQKHGSTKRHTWRDRKIRGAELFNDE